MALPIKDSGFYQHWREHFPESICLLRPLYVRPVLALAFVGRPEGWTQDFA